MSFPARKIPIDAQQSLRLVISQHAGDGVKLRPVPVQFFAGTEVADAREVARHIRLFGKGGHAALSQQCIDPLQPLRAT